MTLEGGISGSYPVGKIFTWNAFTSTSLKDNPAFGDILFIIDFDKQAIESSLYVKPYSEFQGVHSLDTHTHIPPFLPLLSKTTHLICINKLWPLVVWLAHNTTGEEEVLLPPGFMLKVTECNTTTKQVKLELLGLFKIY